MINLLENRHSISPSAPQGLVKMSTFFSCKSIHPTIYMFRTRPAAKISRTARHMFCGNAKVVDLEASRNQFRQEAKACSTGNVLSQSSIARN